MSEPKWYPLPDKSRGEPAVELTSGPLAPSAPPADDLVAAIKRVLTYAESIEYGKGADSWSRVLVMVCNAATENASLRAQVAQLQADADALRGKITGMARDRICASCGARCEDCGGGRT